jgi:hypothetical protein
MKLHKSQWEAKVVDPEIIEYEESRFALPYTDGMVEYLKKHDNRIEVVRVKLSREEWNAIRGSKALKRIVLS